MRSSVPKGAAAARSAVHSLWPVPDEPNTVRNVPPKYTESKRQHVPKTFSPLSKRITPACAGKSDVKAADVSIDWDHPRVCGEKTVMGETVTPGQGSPPRVRGKVTVPLICRVSVGITPACAGKSSITSFRLPLYQDHPRVCGEKSFCSSCPVAL